MPILFSYFAALQTIISTLTQSMSPSPTDSTSIRPNVSNQLDNMSVGVSLTPTTALRSTTRASPITEVSSQGGFFSSSFSSEVTQTTSTLMTSGNIMANITQSMSPSATESKVSSQSQNLSASVSLNPSPAPSLATSASAVAKLTSQGDLVSSSFSTYLSQGASTSMAPHIITSTLTQSMSPSSTESTSFKPSVSSQSDNISDGVSLTPTPRLPLTSRASAITEVSSQGGFFSSSSSSFVTQSTSSLMTSENIMANITQSMSPSVTESKVSSQSQNISASVSLNPSPALSLATSASAVAELTSQGDLVSSSFTTYLSQGASLSMASSSMVDVTFLCICPCGSTSTTSQSTPSLYHSTSGGVISSGPSDQSSQIFYNATIDGNNTTSSSASLSSSVCYCPCNPATSTSYMSLPQTIISTLNQSTSPSSTESTSFRPTVSSQSDNISVGLSLTPTPTLPLTTGTSAVTKVFSQGGFFSSSFSSFVTQSASSLMTSSSMIDATPMCIWPCNPISTTSQSISLLYHSISGAISTSSTSGRSSPFFYILTTTATSTTSASVSLSSSV
ncbi:uncharacterized protein LOC110058843 isoform X2 [Orbicella faveolata]|uniref:uncharacterized protein LOC110058843 isoform X2 n=1 Tax=Orbicella faveolata TaxID=48498 RepID=UPI0009E272D2|nr:uncharacterized protein LOC110058843 isoform X2 [Orbicella faveolata]